MIHEHILTRADGSKVKIEIHLFIGWASSGAEYKTTIYLKGKRQKKWRDMPLSIPDYAFRRINPDERKEQIKSDTLNFVSKEELLDAKMQLWKKLKPTL